MFPVAQPGSKEQPLQELIMPRSIHVKGKLSSNQKILREFPWMWAVSSKWTDESIILVHPLHEKLLAQDCRLAQPGVVWWLKCSKGDDEMVVAINMNGFKQNVAQRILAETPLGYKAEFLICHPNNPEDEGSYIIFRPKARQSLHDFCVSMR